MTEKRTYQSEAKKLSIAIDFAIEAFTKHCPDHFTSEFQNHTINAYLDCRVSCLNPDRENQTLESLDYEIDFVFSYFQEGVGPTVEYFWKKIEKAKLGYARINRLEIILTRGYILDSIEFHHVVDTFLSAQRSGNITRRDAFRLSEMLEQYEEFYRNKAIAS